MTTQPPNPFHRCALAILALAVLSAPFAAAENTFSDDVAFLKKHTKSIVLGTGKGKIVVTPEYQGRVMTSTTGGDGDPSFGWINYKLVEQGDGIPSWHPQNGSGS